VWSSDKARAVALAKRIDTGTVWINDYHMINLRFPFGGYKQSGSGASSESGVSRVPRDEAHSRRRGHASGREVLISSCY